MSELYEQKIVKTDRKPVNPVQNPKTGPNRIVLILLAVVSLTLVILMALAVVLFGKNNSANLPEVNLNEYLKITFEGEDGSGYVNAEFDATSLLNNNREVFSINKNNREIILSMMAKSDVDSDNEIYDYLFGNIFLAEKRNTPFCVSFNPEKELSNGDSVFVNWNDAKNILEKVFPVIINCPAQNLEVNGLTETKQIDTPDSSTSKKNETTTPKPKATPKPEPKTTPKPEPIPTEQEYITVVNGIQAPIDCFIFPYSSSQHLEYSQFDALWGNMNVYDQKYYSQLAIDEIFFRYGWAFNDVNMNDNSRKMLKKFNQYDWYNQAKQYYPSGVDWYTFEVTYMNQIERDNINLLCDWQYDHIPDDLL